MSDGMQIWHDEAERFFRTGHLDEGPCWCTECLELDTPPPA